MSADDETQVADKHVFAAPQPGSARGHPFA